MPATNQLQMSESLSKPWAQPEAGLMLRGNEPTRRICGRRGFTPKQALLHNAAASLHEQHAAEMQVVRPRECAACGGNSRQRAGSGRA